MVVLLVILTILACITVDLLMRRAERMRAAESAGLQNADRLLPSLAAAEVPGGLFLHGGHTWAKLEPSGAVQVGLDGFARGILGRVDRFDLPANGVRLRQGEPAFAALQDGKRIEFVSPVDGIVCAVNPGINDDPLGGKLEPYGKDEWAFAIRPSDFIRNLDKLRIGMNASAWLKKEVERFTEFLVLHRAVPQEVGVTLPDGGIHAEGILETMDGEVLQLVTRKFFR